MLYRHLATFVAGFCFANAVPHGVAGIMGETFPSPFASPPGVGHSSALTNTLWSLTNLVLGYILFRFSRITPEKKSALLIFFLGIATAAITCSIWFAQ